MAHERAHQVRPHGARPRALLDRVVVHARPAVCGACPPNKAPQAMTQMRHGLLIGGACASGQCVAPANRIHRKGAPKRPPFDHRDSVQSDGSFRSFRSLPSGSSARTCGVDGAVRDRRRHEGQLDDRLHPSAQDGVVQLVEQREVVPEPTTVAAPPHNTVRTRSEATVVRCKAAALGGRSVPL